MKKTNHHLRAGLAALLAGAVGIAIAISSPIVANGVESTNLTPHLEKKGDVIQLFVDGDPYLVLGGQVSPAAGTDLTALWPALDNLVGLNTLLVPITWAQIEPTKGTFDWTVLDTLITQARDHGKKLIPLWFGAFNSGTSDSAPAWVKADQTTYPVVESALGTKTDILSPLSSNLASADSAALAPMMAHLKTFGTQKTVIMVQIENEMSLGGLSRDLSTAASTAYSSAVPAGLISYLTANDASLRPELKAAWGTTGKATSGVWPAVLRAGVTGEQAFTAWSFASYANTVVTAAKAAYDIPVFVDVTTASMLDVWLAGAPTVDIFSPDISGDDFATALNDHVLVDRALFVSESEALDVGAANLAAVIGKGGIGYAAGAIEVAANNTATGPFGVAIRQIAGAATYILQGQRTGATQGLSGRGNADGAGNNNDTLQLNMVGVQINFAGTEPGWAIVVNDTSSELIFIAARMNITFSRPDASVGLCVLQSGTFSLDGTWETRQVINGDPVVGTYGGVLNPARLNPLTTTRVNMTSATPQT